jgi:chlorobactene glucosyltransferase
MSSGFIIGLAWLLLVLWLLWRATRQYHAYEVLRPGRWSEPEVVPRLTVIVPARNEAANIERCIASLLAQDYPADRLQIVVVDDHSQDDTPVRVASWARRDARMRLLHGRPLPADWTGKSFACWQGSRIAEGEWLCFVDADTTAKPACLTSAVAAAKRHGLDMLSLAPFQLLVTPPERLVMLVGFLAVAVFKDLRRVNEPAAREAEANGQFLLIRSAAYEAIGGHAAVCSEVAEDFALAREIKQAKYRFRLLGGDELISTRMYTGWRSLREGLAKNATMIFGGPVATLLAAFAALLLGWAAWLLPAGLWLRWPTAGLDPWLLAGALAATLASVLLIATQVAEARYFRIPWWYGLIFTIGYSLAAVVGVSAVCQHISGRTPWKGRSYPVNSRG